MTSSLNSLRVLNDVQRPHSTLQSDKRTGSQRHFEKYGIPTDHSERLSARHIALLRALHTALQRCGNPAALTAYLQSPQVLDGVTQQRVTGLAANQLAAVLDTRGQGHLRCRDVAVVAARLKICPALLTS